jgi:hypothetical protein
VRVRSRRLPMLIGAALAAAACTSVLGDFHLGSREASTASGGSNGRDASSGGSAGSVPTGVGGTGPGGSSAAGGASAAGSGGTDANCDAASPSAPLVSNEDDPHAIAIGGGYVYWVDTAGNAIKRVDESGGTPEIIVPNMTSSAVTSPTCIGLDLSHDVAYWADDKELDTWTFGSNFATSVTSGTFSAVATEGQDVYLGTYQGEISYVAEGGNTVLGSIVVGPNAGTIGGLVVDSNTVYLTVANASDGHSHLDSVPVQFAGGVGNLANGSPRAAGPALGLAEYSANQETYVFWASGDALHRYDATSVQDAQFALAGTLEPAGVAVYDGHVYWTLAPMGGTGTGEVLEQDVEGHSCRRVIASHQPDPVAIAVDSTGVYWVNAGPEGNVMKAALPSP